MKNNIYFVSGIDTDCGKTIATGLIARYLRRQNVNVITQKLIQTGCEEVSEDIESHRQLMGIEMLPVDQDGTTCSYVLKHPASPHLSAALEKVDIDMERINSATRRLSEQFDVVLLEGAGGLFVPITPGYMIIDYIKEMNYPLILVSSAKVGSINHTIMSLELCKQKGIHLQAVIYNHHPNTDELIINDSRKIFVDYLAEHFPGVPLYDIPNGNGRSFEKVAFRGIVD